MGGGVQSREIPFRTGADLERGLSTAQAAARRAELFYDRANEDAGRLASLPAVVPSQSNIRAQAEAAQRRRAAEEAFFSSLIQEQAPPVIAQVEAEYPAAVAEYAPQAEQVATTLLTPRTIARIGELPTAVAKAIPK